ncbi:MAG: hypothetical protein KJ548_14005 [Actinobacteria bacterium]|nr:hypothetical protein [Actinomycetota bacterium]
MPATFGQTIPRLSPRSATVVEVGFLVVGVVIFAIIWVAGPWLWWLSAPMIALLGYLGAVLLLADTWIDPATGTVTRRRWSLRPVRSSLADVTAVQLSTSGGGGARLVLRDGRRRTTIDLVSVTLFASVSQQGPTLRKLAEVLDAHVVPAVRGDVPRRLRAQADHIDRGGQVETSPLVVAPSAH